MTTQNKGLNQPAYNSGSWDVPLNNNFGYIDAALGNTATISNTTAYTLSSSEYQCMRLLFNGSLAADLTISIPSGVGGFWIVTNSTTDVSSSAIKYLTIKTNAGGSLGVTPPRGSSVVIYSDGTHVGYVEGTAPIPSSSTSSGSALIIPGTVITFAGSNAPIGYLSCNGDAVSRSTYASLFAAIGTTWGSGDGTTTFNIPDLRGVFLRGTGTNATGSSAGAVGPAVGAYVADAFQGHYHNKTDPGHIHSYTKVGGNTASQLVNGALCGSASANTASATTNISITAPTTDGTNGAPRTGSETVPKNYGILYCIKT